MLMRILSSRAVPVTLRMPSVSVGTGAGSTESKHRDSSVSTTIAKASAKKIESLPAPKMAHRSNQGTPAAFFISQGVNSSLRHNRKFNIAQEFAEASGFEGLRRYGHSE